MLFLCMERKEERIFCLFVYIIYLYNNIYIYNNIIIFIYGEKEKNFLLVFVCLCGFIFVCMYICLPVFIIACYACFIGVIWRYVLNYKHCIYLCVCFIFIFTLFN